MQAQRKAVRLLGKRVEGSRSGTIALWGTKETFVYMKLADTARYRHRETRSPRGCGAGAGTPGTGSAGASLRSAVVAGAVPRGRPAGGPPASGAALTAPGPLILQKQYRTPSCPRGRGRGEGVVTALRLS